MKKNGFALVIVLVLMTGVLACASAVLYQAILGYRVAYAQYQYYQRYYAGGVEKNKVLSF